jgi:hypothetical protein
MPIARCGYFEYAVVRETFQMVVPADGVLRAALQGSGMGVRRVLEEEEGGEREDAMVGAVVC